MQLFIDSANLDEIREIASWGVIVGVTTNPSLVAKEGADFKKRIQDIAKVVDGPISAEVVSTDAKGMLKEAKDLVTWHPNVVIKIPTTPEGLKAISVLSDQGVATNATLCFNPTQALLVARAGATYVSPFLGRLDDIGDNGIEMLSEIVDIYETHAIETLVLAASLRHVRHVIDAATVGADVATLPYGVFKQMMQHPLTDSGLEKFLADWKKAKKGK